MGSGPRPSGIAVYAPFRTDRAVSIGTTQPRINGDFTNGLSESTLQP
jgi:hypothetical protein